MVGRHEQRISVTRFQRESPVASSVAKPQEMGCASAREGPSASPPRGCRSTDRGLGFAPGTAVEVDRCAAATGSRLGLQLHRCEPILVKTAMEGGGQPLAFGSSAR